jgi:hypothetical protein
MSRLRPVWPAPEIATVSSEAYGRAGVQPGQPVAATGAAEENRRLVADQLAAAVGEDGRATDQARQVLLLLLAEGHLHRRLFGQMLRRMDALPVPSG